MARLIHCPDCGASVSRKATSCPKCGRPLKRPGFLTQVARVGCLAIVGLFILAFVMSLGLPKPADRRQLDFPTDDN
jgi:zinc-ribbon domain